MLKKVIDTDGFNAVIKGRYGYVVFNKNDKYIGKSIEHYGEYSIQEADLLQKLCRQGDIVVEVGANIGALTMMLARSVGDSGRVYAFEPQRIVFQTLCANMAINSISNVECFQAAVSSEAGHIFVPEIEYDKTKNFGDFQADAFVEGDRVIKIVLDDFLELPRFRLLKVDVEGMEYNVVMGAKKLIEKFHPILYVENDREEKAQQLIDYIKSHDYRLFVHIPFLFNAANYAGNDENIFGIFASRNMLCIHKSHNVSLSGLEEI